jgi:hypothetical protein
MNNNYIEEAELSYLYNYDDQENYRLKDWLSKKGRQEIRDEIKEKAPKLGKILDSKVFKGLSKVALIGGAVALAGPALAALGPAYVGTASGSAKTLTGFKPAMQAFLKKKGVKTNGLPLKDVVKKFLKAKGETSTGAENDLGKVAGFFSKIKERKAEGKGNEEDNFLSDLIDGTTKRLETEGETLMNKMITGEDAAPDSPTATPESTGTATGTTTETAPGKMNIALIAGAAVVLYFLMKKK